MPRAVEPRNSFVAGEISPRLDARVDLTQYVQGCRTLENGLVFSHGGVTRRTGSIFVEEAKDPTDNVRLKDFVVADDVSYVIEFGDLYARFYTNGARVESPPGTPVEVVTPWAASELADLQFTQSVNDMWIAHPNYWLRRLRRTSATSFSLIDMKTQWTQGLAPYDGVNATAISVTVSGAGPTYTLTWNASIGLTAGADVGRHVGIAQSPSYVQFRITGVVSGSQALAVLESTTPALGVITNEVDWRLGMMSDTQGVRAVMFAEGRLWVGGSVAEPNRVVSSVSGNPQVFDYRTALDDRSVARSLVSNAAAVVEWLAPGSGNLHAGTLGREFTIRGANDDLITPATAVAKTSTAYGSPHIQPVAVDSTIIFPQASRQHLRELKFSVAQDGDSATPLTLLCEHIYRTPGTASGGGLTEMALQLTPDTIIWSPRDDGQLVGVTRELAASVIAGHRHKLGGAYLGDDYGHVQSLAVVPSADRTHDQLWLAVRRRINGVDKMHIEYLAAPYTPGTTRRSTREERINAAELAYFVDCGLSLDAPLAVTAVSIGATTVATSTAHGLSNGQRVRLRGVRGVTSPADAALVGYYAVRSSLNNRSYLVANVTANTFELRNLDGSALDTTGYTPYVHGGTARREASTVSGLGHLDGEEVAIVTDGYIHPRKVVTGGSVTLDWPASIVHVGLASKFVLETTRLLVSTDALAKGVGVEAHIRHLVFRVVETLDFQYGVGGTADIDLLSSNIRQADDPMDAAIPVFTGDLPLVTTGDTDREPVVYIEQVDPLPLTVLGVFADTSSNVLGTGGA